MKKARPANEPQLCPFVAYHLQGSNKAIGGKVKIEEYEKRIGE